MKLSLITALPTAEMRRGIFPQPADAAEKVPCDFSFPVRGNSFVRNPYQVFCSPYLCARETCTWMALLPVFEPALADRNYGRWQGKSLKTIAIQDPLAFKKWQHNPPSAPPEGESMEAVRKRANFWLKKIENLTANTQLHILAVTHAAIVRGIISSLLSLHDQASLKLDIAPITGTMLSFRGQWRIQSMGTPLIEKRPGSFNQRGNEQPKK